jgi:hypothetical protein
MTNEEQIANNYHPERRRTERYWVRCTTCVDDPAMGFLLPEQRLRWAADHCRTHPGHGLDFSRTRT